MRLIRYKRATLAIWILLAPVHILPQVYLEWLDRPGGRGQVPIDSVLAPGNYLLTQYFSLTGVAAPGSWGRDATASVIWFPVYTRPGFFAVAAGSSYESFAQVGPFIGNGTWFAMAPDPSRGGYGNARASAWANVVFERRGDHSEGHATIFASVSANRWEPNSGSGAIATGRGHFAIGLSVPKPSELSAQSINPSGYRLSDLLKRTEFSTESELGAPEDPPLYGEAIRSLDPSLTEKVIVMTNLPTYVSIAAPYTYNFVCSIIGSEIQEISLSGSLENSVALRLGNETNELSQANSRTITTATTSFEALGSTPALDLRDHLRSTIRLRLSGTNNVVTLRNVLPSLPQPLFVFVPTNTFATDTADFAIVTAVSAPLVQWRRNGVFLPGATNTVLSVSNFQPVNEGYYDVVLVNDRGTKVARGGYAAADRRGKLSISRINDEVLSIKAIGAAGGIYELQSSDQLPNFSSRFIFTNRTGAEMLARPTSASKATFWRLLFSRDDSSPQSPATE